MIKAKFLVTDVSEDKIADSCVVSLLNTEGQDELANGQIVLKFVKSKMLTPIGKNSELILSFDFSSK